MRLEVPSVIMKWFHLKLVVVLGVAFIAWGDRIFPGRLGAASQQVRSQIVRSLKAAFPSDIPGQNPSERTRKEIENLEQR